MAKTGGDFMEHSISPTQNYYEIYDLLHSDVNKSDKVIRTLDFIGYLTQEATLDIPSEYVWTLFALVQGLVKIEDDVEHELFIKNLADEIGLSLNYGCVACE